MADYKFGDKGCMKKFIRTVVFIASVIMGVYLLCFNQNTVRYSAYIIDQKELEAVMQGRAEVFSLLEALYFNEEALFYDNASRTFYYSLIEGNAGAYDPDVRIKSKNEDLKIAFIKDGITAEGIKNNDTITLLAYTGEAYCRYFLKCTTLPLMNIECSEEILDDSVPMSMVLFDNRQGAAMRVTASGGKIHLRGATARLYPKKGYRFSLTQESVGGNLRNNQVPLLGMRPDDDWLLYAAYNDQEKIRNVFSSNLWEYTCATDNAYGINTGMEYRYLELFLNGAYCGLYALGYPIDEKQLAVDKRNEEEALYKVTDWISGNVWEYAGEEPIKGYTDKGADGESANWLPLQKYCDALAHSLNDNEKLYAAVDINNAIDIYLFYNLIQGTDNVSKEYVKNHFFSLHKRQGKVIAMYSPWDMDDTWGNTWRGDFPVNEQQPYALSEKYNHVMESGVVNRLIANGDGAVWEKIFDKYGYLRENGWSDENVNALLDEYEKDIFASGAYMRDRERWPEGNYADAAEGLKPFRTFVMGRLREFDAYFERLKGVCRDSIFIRRSAQYASFEEGSFLIEINEKELLRDSDYRDLFEYMGIDISAVTEEVRFILAKPVEGKYEYLSGLGEAEGDRETFAGKLSFSEIEKGLYEVSLDGTVCCTSAVFFRPAVRMVSVKGGMAEQFDFGRGNTLMYTAAFQSLSEYMEGLCATQYNALIEINNLNIWQDSSYVGLFENLGIAGGGIGEKTDFIVWDGGAQEALLLEAFHAADNECDTAVGMLDLFVNRRGEYGVYMDGGECFVSSTRENEEEGKDIRILWFDPESGEMVGDLAFVYSASYE